MVVINDAMARKYWPGPDAIGKRFRTRSADGPEVEVVGIPANLVPAQRAPRVKPWLALRAE